MLLFSFEYFFLNVSNCLFNGMENFAEMNRNHLMVFSLVKGEAVTSPCSKKQKAWLPLEAHVKATERKQLDQIKQGSIHMVIAFAQCSAASESVRGQCLCFICARI